MDGVPVLAVRAPEDDLEDLLREAQYAILAHPVAAQAIYRTLVAEGRRFATTPEGQRMRERLASSVLARRMREAWELGTLQALDAEHDGPYPSDFVDLLFAAAASGRPLLAGLLPGGSR